MGNKVDGQMTLEELVENTNNWDKAAQYMNALSLMIRGLHSAVVEPAVRAELESMLVVSADAHVWLRNIAVRQLSKTLSAQDANAKEKSPAIDPVVVH